MNKDGLIIFYSFQEPCQPVVACLLHSVLGMSVNLLETDFDIYVFRGNFFLNIENSEICEEIGMSVFLPVFFIKIFS